MDIPASCAISVKVEKLFTGTEKAANEQLYTSTSWKILDFFVSVNDLSFKYQMKLVEFVANCCYNNCPYVADATYQMQCLNFPFFLTIMNVMLKIYKTSIPFKAIGFSIITIKSLGISNLNRIVK